MLLHTTLVPKMWVRRGNVAPPHTRHTAPGTFWTHMGRVLRTLHATHKRLAVRPCLVCLAGCLHRFACRCLLFSEGRVGAQPRNAGVQQCGGVAVRGRKGERLHGACIMRIYICSSVVFSPRGRLVMHVAYYAEYPRCTTMLEDDTVGYIPTISS